VPLETLYLILAIVAVGGLSLVFGRLIEGIYWSRFAGLTAVACIVVAMVVVARAALGVE
jgi:Na+/pantothenate symporter